MKAAPHRRTPSGCRNRVLQLTEANQRLAIVKKPVLVCEHLDGLIRLWFRERELTWVELTKRPQKPKRQDPAKKAAGKPHQFVERPDDNCIVAWNGDGTLRCWDGASLQMLWTQVSHTDRGTATLDAEGGVVSHSGELETLLTKFGGT